MVEIPYRPHDIRPVLEEGYPCSGGQKLLESHCIAGFRRQQPFHTPGNTAAPHKQCQPRRAAWHAHVPLSGTHRKAGDECHSTKACTGTNGKIWAVKERH